MELEIHEHLTEQLALHAHETDLDVVLPGHIITGADMGVVIILTVEGHSLHCLGLGLFLRSQTVAAERGEKIDVAAGIEPVGAFKSASTTGE